MHRLQWMQTPSVARPAASLLTRSGSRSRARPMATKSKPSAIACSIVSTRLMPPSSISGIVSADAEAQRLLAEVRLLEGVGLEEALAHRRLHAEAYDEGHRRGELLQRRLAAEEVHRVHQRRAAAELEGVEGAVGLEQLGVLEPGVGRHAALEAVGQRDLRGDGDLVADLVAYGARHLAAEPGAVLERAAVPVLAAVEARARGTTRSGSCAPCAARARRSRRRPGCARWRRTPW